MFLFNDATEYKMNKLLSAALAEKETIVSTSSRDFEDIKTFQPFKLRNEVFFLSIFCIVPFQYITNLCFRITIKHTMMIMRNMNMV